MKQPARHHQAGFTLVELMVSMVIGLLIVLALVTLLINVNRNNSELSRTNRVIENGRFALQLLQADVAHAGFWAGHVPNFDDLSHSGAANDVPTAVPDPCQDSSTWDAAYRANLVGIAVQTYEIPAVVPSPTLPVCASRVFKPQPSTDVLVVRHVENCAAGVSGCAAPVANDLYFQVARCGDIAPSPAYVLDPYPSVPANVPVIFPLKRRAVTVAGVTPACTDAVVPYESIHKFVSNLYYVRDFAVTVGDGVPTLMRSQHTGTNHGTAEALIEGIQGFRVELGIDNVSDSGAALTAATFNTTTGVGAAVSWQNAAVLNSPTNRGDGFPDTYVHCTTASPCSPFQLMNAVVAKIFVLVRSETPSPGYQDTKTYTLGSMTLGPFNDGYKRHLFTQTIRLTNVSGRRETP